MVETKFTVKIKFRRFTNPGGRDEGGSYCEGVSSSCETYFKLCVKLSGSITASLSGCDYQPASLRYIKSNNIDFQTQNTNINKTILLQRNQWNGVCFKLWFQALISRTCRILKVGHRSGNTLQMLLNFRSRPPNVSFSFCLSYSFLAI